MWINLSGWPLQSFTFCVSPIPTRTETHSWAYSSSVCKGNNGFEVRGTWLLAAEFIIFLNIFVHCVAGRQFRRTLTLLETKNNFSPDRRKRKLLLYIRLFTCRKFCVWLYRRSWWKNKNKKVGNFFNEQVMKRPIRSLHRSGPKNVVRGFMKQTESPLVVRALATGYSL